MSESLGISGAAGEQQPNREKVDVNRLSLAAEQILAVDGSDHSSAERPGLFETSWTTPTSTNLPEKLDEQYYYELKRLYSEASPAGQQYYYWLYVYPLFKRDVADEVYYYHPKYKRPYLMDMDGNRAEPIETTAEVTTAMYEHLRSGLITFGCDQPALDSIEDTTFKEIALFTIIEDDLIANRLARLNQPLPAPARNVYKRSVIQLIQNQSDMLDPDFIARRLWPTG